MGFQLRGTAAGAIAGARSPFSVIRSGASPGGRDWDGWLCNRSRRRTRDDRP